MKWTDLIDRTSRTIATLLCGVVSLFYFCCLCVDDRNISVNATKYTCVRSVTFLGLLTDQTRKKQKWKTHTHKIYRRTNQYKNYRHPQCIKRKNVNQAYFLFINFNSFLNWTKVLTGIPPDGMCPND